MMKKTLAFLLSLCLTLSLVSCGASGNGPGEIVSKLTDAIIVMDTTKVAEYVAEANISTIEEDDALMTDYLKALFKGAKYKVDEVVEDGDSAVVTISISVKSLNAISETLNDLNEKFNNDPSLYESEDDLIKEFTKIIEENPSKEMVTTTVNINLIKENDKWIVEDATPILTALVSGASSM